MSDEAERRVDTADRLARLETKVDQCLDGIKYTHNISDRVRALEFFKHAVMAVVTFVAAAFGYVKWGGN